MITLTMMLAVLVPGLDLHEQPHLPGAITARAAVETQLQEAMENANAAVTALLAEREAHEQEEAAAAARDAGLDPAYEPTGSSGTTAELSERHDLVAADRYGVGEPWATLAECESGNWVDGGSSFERGSARWAWGGGDPIPPWGTRLHDGGLQFAPSTWRWVAPMVGLGHIDRAYQATPQQQVAVAIKTQQLQGWPAWPVCSARMGLS